jgi:hypothetical protein
MRSHMLGWSLPPANIDEAYGAFPPVTVLSHSGHRAKLRQHICSECYAPIHIGERYFRTVYKDDETGKIGQYKTHAVCPYEEDWS